MNIRLVKILILLTTISLLFSCEKEPPAQLDLSTTYILLSNSEAQQTISITANGKWTASLVSTWCTISPSSGDGNGEITIIANENASIEERSVELRVFSRELKRLATISQNVSALSVNAEEFEFSRAAVTRSVNVSSNTDWKVIIPATETWITATPLTGKGNGTITFNVAENISNSRNTSIEISFANSSKNIIVTQKRGLNVPFDPPLLKYPENNNLDANRLPTFRWSGIKGADVNDFDYTVEYSDDINNFDNSFTLSDTVFNLSSYLDANKKYYWRVSASEKIEGGAPAYSQVGTFTTGTKTSYFDGEYKVAQTHSKGIKPSEILFVGDGYISEDFEEGGQFDADMDEGIEAFFAIEPYKSYRDYFTVYKQAAYSRDRGVKQSDKNILKSSKFDSDFLGGSSLFTNFDVVFEYAQKIPGIDNAKLKNLLIILVLNENRYAGTTWMWPTGEAIAITPVSRSTSPESHFSNLINHEAGGHGFGRLADEYVSAENMGKMITEKEKDVIKSWVSYGYYSNVDLIGDVSNVKWSYLIGISGYERVSTIVGGFYFSLGVWKPEVSSCMLHNEKYYNAPSREAMVKRIYKTAGLNYTFEAFLEKDIIKAPSKSVLMHTKSINPLTFMPLAPPVLMD